MAAACEESLKATCRCAQCTTLVLYETLREEFAPVGAAENILVAEMARRAASMDWWSAATGAVRRTAANRLADLLVPEIESTQSADTILAASASCDAVDRAERNSFAQSRAFYRALQLLLHLQQCRRAPGKTAVAERASRFSTEADCLNYLVNWDLANYLCRACGARRAQFIASRNCLQCAACGAQSGLRVATVMADSPVPLVTWFKAVGIVAHNPDIAIAELQRELALSRRATVRGMAAKIRAALTADDRTELLAGLDRYFLETESSVPSSKNPVKPNVISCPQVNCTQIISHQQLAPNQSWK